MSKHLERLNNIYWSFSKKYYNTVEEFKKDIEEYNISCENEKEWRLDELVVNEPKIEMQYMAWVDPEHILPNEELMEDDDIFEEESDDDEYGYQVELAATLLPDNGKSFLGYELLMKVHNQQANKELGDHVFYEGTEIERGENGIAILPIYCGS